MCSLLINVAIFHKNVSFYFMVTLWLNQCTVTTLAFYHETCGHDKTTASGKCLWHLRRHPSLHRAGSFLMHVTHCVNMINMKYVSQVGGKQKEKRSSEFREVR